MQKSNFHTHTTDSDGRNSAREMIEAALGCGFTALGFSDHSYAPSETDYCMSPDGMRRNVDTVRALAEEYRGRIRIYAGAEWDAESTRPEYWNIDHDYRIGAVHEMVRRGVSMPIDSSAAEQQTLIDELFGGSRTAFAEGYYEALTEHIRRNRFDIVAHYDLITKYGLIPEDDFAVFAAAAEAIPEILPFCRTFELNTGAIARGLRIFPYPSLPLLKELYRLGGRIIVTSDCHDAERLTCWFDEAEELLSSVGFRKDEHAALNDRVTDVEIWEPGVRM